MFTPTVGTAGDRAQDSAHVLPVLLTAELNGSGSEEKEGVLGNHAGKRSLSSLIFLPGSWGDQHESTMESQGHSVQAGPKSWDHEYRVLHPLSCQLV